MPKPDRQITHNGRTQTLAQWARQLGITKGGLAARIRQIGTARALSGRTTRCATDKLRSGVVLDEVALEIGVSRERVRQIEVIALAKVEIAKAMIGALSLEVAWPVISSLSRQPLSKWRRAWRMLVAEAYRRAA